MLESAAEKCRLAQFWVSRFKLKYTFNTFLPFLV